MPTKNALGYTIYTDEELRQPLRAGPQREAATAPVSGGGVERNTEIMIKDAFGAVFYEHSTTSHKIATWASRSVSTKIRNLSRADAAKLAVTGGVVLAGALTGGLAIGAAIAVGAGAYIVKKGIDRFASYKRNAELRKRWINLGQAYTELPPDLRERKKAELAKESNKDAKDAVRKCIVHLRKAVDHYNTHIKDADTTFPFTCDEALVKAKPIYKFIHEYDKFRSYLLPNMLCLSIMIANFRETTSKWRDASRECELKLDSHVRKRWHGLCDEGECYHQSVSRTVRTFESQTPPTTQLTITRLNDALATVFDQLVEAVVTSKSLSRGSGSAFPMSSTPAGDARWLCFRTDLLRRYDDPSRGRQIRHFMTNRSMATTQGEKIAAVVGALVEIGSLSGDPFLGHAVDGLSFVASHAATSGTSAGEQLIDQISQSLIVGNFTNDRGDSTGLLASGSAAVGVVNGPNAKSVPVDQAFKNDEDVKKAFKYDAVAAEKLVDKMERHWKSALEVMGTCDSYCKMRYFRTCGEAMVLATGVAEVGYHLNKFEKYLLAYYAIVSRFVLAAKNLTEAERQAYDVLESLKPAVSKRDHSECREHGTVCYGPKHTTTGVFTKTTVVNETQPHKPL